MSPTPYPSSSQGSPAANLDRLSPGPSAPDARAGWAFWIGLALALIVAVGMEAWLASHRSLNDDDLGQAIAARHILAGCGLPLHPYGGPTSCGASLHAWMAAPIFALFGPTENAMRAAILVHVGLLASLFYALIFRAVSSMAGAGAGAAAGGVATLLLILGTPNLTVNLMEAHHHTWGLVFMVTQMNLFDRLGRSSRPALPTSALLGLASAIAFWASAATASLTAPLLFLLAWEARSRVGLARLGTAVGAGSLALFGMAKVEALTALTVVGMGVPLDIPRFLSRGLANLMFLSGDHFARSFRPPHLSLTPSPVVDALLTTAAAGALAMPLLGLVGRGRARRPDTSRSRLMQLAVFQVAAFFLVFSFSQYTRGTPEVPKYFLYTYPSLVLVGAIEAFHLPRMFRWMLCVLVASLVVQTQAEPLRVWGRDGRAAAAIQRLQQLGIDRIYCQYWLAWRILFLGGERILTTTDDVSPRYLPYDEEVWRAPRYAVVLADYGPLRARVEEALHQEGVTCARWDGGGVHILYDFHPDARTALSRAVPAWGPVKGRAKAWPLPPVFFRSSRCAAVAAPDNPTSLSPALGWSPKRRPVTAAAQCAEVESGDQPDEERRPSLQLP